MFGYVTAQDIFGEIHVTSIEEVLNQIAKMTSTSSIPLVVGSIDDETRLDMMDSATGTSDWTNTHSLERLYKTQNKPVVHLVTVGLPTIEIPPMGIDPFSADAVPKSPAALSTSLSLPRIPDGWISQWDHAYVSDLSFFIRAYC